MRDIYHELIKHEPDFKNHSDDALVCAVDIYASAARGIYSALALIGNLTLDVLESEGYSNDDARRDLDLVGNALRHLPRIARAMEGCSDSAQYALRERRGDASCAAHGYGEA